MFNTEKKEILVDALQDGKIIRATEEYARREGLIILRKFEHMNPNVVTPEIQGGHISKNERKGLLKFEEFRRPLKGDKNNIISELVDNFHWIILKRRKERGVSRLQMARELNVPEYDLKMLESGVVLGDDFVLISKVEKYLGTNLRRDGKDYHKSPLQSLTSGKDKINQPVHQIKQENPEEKRDGFSGDEIDLSD